MHLSNREMKSLRQPDYKTKTASLCLSAQGDRRTLGIYDRRHKQKNKHETPFITATPTPVKGGGRNLNS